MERLRQHIERHKLMTLPEETLKTFAACAVLTDEQLSRLLAYKGITDLPRVEFADFKLRMSLAAFLMRSRKHSDLGEYTPEKEVSKNNTSDIPASKLLKPKTHKYASGLCPTCNGYGAIKSASKSIKCRRCSGTGWVR
ncbi:MAG: hypothetical protein HZA18_03305 [Nitrospirae bacterium]|nr:hypothetical protein [Nitrospirota bacterium]